MFEFSLVVLVIGLSVRFLDVTALFDFSAGLVAFFFIIVCVLIFIFIYDNLRKQKYAAPTTA